MGVVLAALDNSLAVNPVLVVARALARVLGDRVEAVHVLGEGTESAESAAGAAGVPLRLSSGRVVERLVEAGHAPEVDAVVIGARGTVRTGNPLGSTALAVVSSLGTPVVVVPPDGRVAPRLHRVLVPLEGTTSTSLAPRSIVELAADVAIDVIVLRIDEEGEPDVTADEFLARYCPWGIDSVRLEQRSGSRDQLVPLLAEETGADLIAFGWADQLSAGRARSSKPALKGAHVPVMLIPVLTPPEVMEGALR